jgi:integrase
MTPKVIRFHTIAIANIASVPRIDPNASGMRPRLQRCRNFRLTAKTMIVCVWVRMELELFLAERTGKGLGSIRQLRWEDFGFERQVAYWRAEADKKGYKWEVPIPADFFEAVRTFQRAIGAVGGFVFSAPNSRGGITDRHLFDRWLSVAEKKAKLTKLDGSRWHAYSRKWAIERKRLPLKDVAAAGGWKGVGTLLEAYQSDEESVLAVTSVTLKLRERGVA